MIPKLIQRDDFIGVVNISEHCAEGDEILNQFIEERQNLDFTELLGNCFYNEILENRNSADYANLLDGGTYTVDGKKRRHYGLRRVLVHFAFGAYVYRGGMVDTPFSVVQKQSEDSIPVPTTELRNLRDENRRMGYSYWKMTFDYLCNARKDDSTVFPCFEDCDCPVECTGCGDSDCNSCKGRKPDRTRSHRVKVIRKNG